MKRTRARVDVNLHELGEVLDQAREAPLSEPDYQKIKDTLHTLVELLAPSAEGGQIVKSPTYLALTN